MQRFVLLPGLGLGPMMDSWIGKSFRQGSIKNDIGIRNGSAINRRRISLFLRSSPTSVTTVRTLEGGKWQHWNP